MCYLAFSLRLSRPHIPPGVSGLFPIGELSLARSPVYSLVRCRKNYHRKLLNLFSSYRSPTTSAKNWDLLENLPATPRGFPQAARLTRILWKP